MLYDFTIQYCQDTLNPADESSWRLNYMMMKQDEKCHESAEKFCELNFKQSQSMSTQNSDSSLTFVENKLTFWQIDDLISILVNKLATAVLETDKQYSCCIRETDFKMKCLIQVLSLQVII